MITLYNILQSCHLFLMYILSIEIKNIVLSFTIPGIRYMNICKWSNEGCTSHEECWPSWGSNSQSLDCQLVVLPTELPGAGCSHIQKRRMNDWWFDCLSLFQGYDIWTYVNGRTKDVHRTRNAAAGGVYKYIRVLTLGARERTWEVSVFTAFIVVIGNFMY